jgi:hypothetical protein
MVFMKNTDNKTAVATTDGVQKPEWIRPKDVPMYFGIGRTRIYELIAENAIKSLSLRKRGQRHGTRLISYASLSAYFENLSQNSDL